MQISFGERSFRIGLIVWVAIGVIAYWLLPWFALEYGLFDATVDEYFDALGWRSHKLSLLAPLCLLALVPPALIQIERRTQGLLLIFISAAGAMLIVGDFIRADHSMGLGTAVILMSLTAVFAYGIARLGGHQGDTFISGAVSFIILIIGIFIFFPNCFGKMNAAHQWHFVIRNYQCGHFF